MTRFLLASFVLAGAVGVASAANDSSANSSPLVAEQFAWQWPLEFPAGAGMAQLTLTPAVYRQLHRDDLADLAAFNGAGESIPLGPVSDQRNRQPAPLPQALSLPMFPLDTQAADSAEGFRLNLERDARGQLRRLDVESTPENLPAPAAASGWIVDGSQLDQPLIGFRIGLAENGADDLNASVLIEGSNDLQRWTSAAPPRALVSLSRDGLRLQRLTLDVPSARYAYWRLRSASDDALPVSSVQALVMPGGAAPDPFSRVKLQTPTATEQAGGFSYQLFGPLPVERLEITLAERNSLANVVIESRAQSDRPWTERARAVAFLLPGDIGMQPLAIAPTRDRLWRLRSDPPLSRAPELTAAYRADRFVVLAQGQAPYRLAAGSATARRPNYPLQVPLAAVAASEPGDSSVIRLVIDGKGSALAGESALSVPKAPTPWRQLALWAVLLLGAVAIGGMAIGLLRSRAAQDDNR